MQWNKEEIIIHNDLFFDQLFQAISEAKLSIFLETYILENDSLGRKMIEALNEAQMRGIDVRIVLDAVGSKITPFSHPFFHKLALFKYKVYHPFNFKFNSFNKRNHRKYVLIDFNSSNAHAWIGSQNITSTHLSAEKGGDDWRDTAVYIQGDELQDLNFEFLKIWDRKPLPLYNKQTLLQKKIRFNSTLRKRLIFFKNLLHKIQNTKELIWITTPYFVPSRRLLKHLKKCAQAGKDVRILLPVKSDVFFMPWVSICFYEELLKSGVQIYEYQKSFLHAKMLIIDDWVTIGSTNLNHRSLFHDLEADIILTYVDNIAKSKEIFLLDLIHSKQILLNELKWRPFWMKWLGRIFLSFRFFL